MKKSLLFVLLSHALWGILPVFWKLLDYVGQWHTWYILASRIVWSFAFLALIFVCKRNFDEIKAVFSNKKALLTLMLCGVLITINWGSYIYAVCTNHVIDGSLACYLNPILSVLIGAVFFRERLSSLQWTAVGLACMGLIWSCIGSDSVPYLAFIMSFSFTAYGAIKKPVKCDSKTSVFCETLTVFPFAMIYILICGFPTALPHVVLPFAGKLELTGALSQLLPFVLVPMCGIITVFPLLLFASGIKDTDYTVAGMLTYINPTLQLVLGLAYGESIDSSKLITFACVWLAMLLFFAEGFIAKAKARKASSRETASTKN